MERLDQLNFRRITDNNGGDGLEMLDVVVDAIRLIQHFSPGHGDYIQERHQWLDKVPLDGIFTEMRQYKALKTEDDFEEVID